MALRVDKWQCGRPQWSYSPILQFYWRFVMTTMMDAQQIENGIPTDEALLARDWIARSEPDPDREYISFPECCAALGCDVDAERVAILEFIDKQGDFDTEECDARLDVLSAKNPDETDHLFELPDWARVVPALDQISLFSQALN